MTQADTKLPAESAANNIIDDEALVRRFNQGDGSAFDKIVEKYSGDNFNGIFHNHFSKSPCQFEVLRQQVLFLHIPSVLVYLTVMK